jgi:dTDP-4-dehydrorhamnose reductase
MIFMLQETGMKLKRILLMKIKILVTGGTGYVGQIFCDKIRREYPEIDLVIIGFNRKKLNIVNVNLCQLSEVKKLIEKEKPTHLFHFAAMVNPRLNEENKFESYRKNFIIANNIVASCCKDTTVFFLSTDKVYDEKNINAREEDISEIPNNFYSLMKLISENMISSNFNKHYILRCPIIHSLGNSNSNSFIDAAIIKLNNKEKIDVFGNVTRHYILVEELVDFLVYLIFSNKYGTYNVGTKAMTYFERISTLAKGLNLDTGLITKTTGNVSPQIQTYNLNKLHSTFKKLFN